MNSRNAIHEELQELSSSLPMDKQPVFTVPEGYFENFAAAVLAKIKSQHATETDTELQELSPMLAAISKKMPFAVPEGYFSNLAKDIPAITADDELPAFLQHAKQMPYTVPQGYFENLADNVLSKVQKPTAKVISFPKSFMRYAAAAVITGIVAISSIVYFKGNSTIDPSKQSEEWVAKKLKNVSNEALEDFINNADVSTDVATSTKSKTEVRSMLQNVSNKELDAFLDDVPMDDEIMMATN
jgi:hypothetical protein